MKVINGVGTKVIQDLKRRYSTRAELIIDLKSDKVSLRDDVVEKLKKYLGV